LQLFVFRYKFKGMRLRALATSSAGLEVEEFICEEVASPLIFY
jgi:hypothetical protein